MRVSNAEIQSLYDLGILVVPQGGIVVLREGQQPPAVRQQPPAVEEETPGRSRTRRTRIFKSAESFIDAAIKGFADVGSEGQDDPNDNVTLSSTLAATRHKSEKESEDEEAAKKGQEKEEVTYNWC